MRSLLSIFAVLCLAGWAFAAAPMGSWGAAPAEPPGIDATGGPDAYGYTWIDSNEPGGPVYNWKDISSTGTLVTGLGDDNVVGPFPIGFTFHYYWYDITQYWIESNGALKFGTGELIIPHLPMQQNIPSTILPNDFADVYMADWYCGVPSGTGQCYRWNNADSLVVSWINLHPWVGPGVTDGAHTFQAILSRLDSSLTFQYGAQTGTVYGNQILVGIECNTGLVGLERANDAYMPANYAIYWNSPSTTSYVAHDMAATASGNANSEGFFVLNNTAVVPYAKVQNVGNQTEASFTVNCSILQTGGGTVYNQTVTQGPLAPGAELQINFSPSWTPSVNAQYIMRITVNLTGDPNAVNNQKNCEVHVMTLPGTMMYDDGAANGALSWIGGNGGAGVRYVPPQYPVVVDSIRYFIYGGSATAHPFTAQVLDDDGLNGAPGTVLFTQSINTPTAQSWYGAVTNITINSGAFYVAWQMQDSLTATIGQDSTLQLGSRQSYEYTGVWALYRDAEAWDMMIRARIHSPGVVPNVTITITPVNPPIIIPPTGGSFDWNLSLHNGESTPQTIDIWSTITMPSGGIRPGWGPYLGLTMSPGGTINRTRTQDISSRYPAGNYTYTGNIGVYPNTVWSSSSFPFSKAALGADGWSNGDQVSAGLTPDHYVLYGATPNPFNPTTTLSYALPQAGQVKLSVFNVTGREVARLVNGWRDAGTHEVTFDASGLASGLYIYQLTAGSFNATGKMMLLK